MSSCGRFDQYLWPFLKRDLENGTITLDETQELVDLLWLKYNERLQLLEALEDPIAGDIGKLIEANIERQVRQVKEGIPIVYSFGTKTYQGTFGLSGANYNEFFQNLTLSGLTPEGQDATNPLTYLALNATYRLKLVKPEMYVRLHKESPPELYERAVDLIIAGLANPNIFNDEAIVTALVKAGFPIEDAREYGGDGCWEAHPQGRTYFMHDTFCATELLERTLSLASWNVPDVPKYTKELDPFIDVVVPDPYTYYSFDKMMETFKKLIDTYIKAWIKYVIMTRDGRRYEIVPLPLFSALVEGPLDSGKDITQGGARYQQEGIVLKGLSHTVDSLAVIKKLCFEEKAVEWTELLDAIRNNWEGKESLRHFVMTRAPAYGNDIDYVDDIAREIIEFYIESIRKNTTGVDTNIIFAPGIATFGNNASDGYVIGATPDGRLAKEPLSTNASPSVGRAIHGQTAALNSYLKLPHTDLPIAAPLDLAIPKRSCTLLQVEALIRAFVEGKGSLLTFSVNNCEDLRAAQKEPGKYHDLKIRVGGWEAYFVDLPPVQQDFQIQKCEQYA
jgi:formate C-acetyltransferase